jgi:acyl dehydratase
MREQGLFFEDFSIGDQFATPGRTVTDAEIALFAGLSGDFNPLHTDEEFAKTTPFGRRVAHGVLGLALAIGLSSRLGLFDGTGLAFLGVEWSFRRPIFIGDTVHVRFTVRDKRPAKKPGGGILALATELVNQRGEIVQEGSRTYLVRTREGGAA